MSIVHLYCEGHLELITEPENKKRGRFGELTNGEFFNEGLKVFE